MADPFACGNCGEIYVIHGGDTLPEIIDLSSNDTPITRLIGSGTEQEYGVGMICADVTGDQYDEVIVASYPNPYNEAAVPKVTVVYGESVYPDSIYLAYDTTLTRILGEDHNDGFGRDPVCGNLGGDDAGDLVVGAPYSDPPGRLNAGKAYLFFGITEATGIVSSPSAVFTLSQNYPNPFNPTTAIAFELPDQAHVNLSIYDVRGTLVATLLNQTQSAGVTTVRWDGRNASGTEVTSGVYFCRLMAGDDVLTRKMVVLR
jgi:hypothetical protein